MAHHKSAVKRNRQSLEARERNRKVRSTMRTEVKKAVSAIGSGEAKDPNGGVVQTAVKVIAKSAKKGVLHKKTAARRISRLMKAANKSAK